MNAVAEDMGVSFNQMLTFALDTESYGIDIQRVQEIRGWSAPRPIPEAPHYVLGVLDLRGTIVPIIDLRARIGMPSIEPTATTVIIVLSVRAESGTRLYGVVADAVSDVADLDSSLRPVPGMAGMSGTAEYLRGIVNQAEHMVLVLDIDALLGDSGLRF